MEKSLETAWVNPQIGWGSVCQVNEDSDTASTSQLCVGVGLRKGTMASASTFV